MKQDGPSPHLAPHGNHDRRTANAEAARTFHEGLRKNDPAAQPDTVSRLLFWQQAKTRRGQRTLRIVWAVLLAQLLFSLFIIAHETLELDGMRSMLGNRIVVAVGLFLLVSVLVSLYAVNILLREIRGADAARAVAGGALAELVDQHFHEWKLTSAERDVALFTLKGFETQEIADLRHAAQGTVRVQLAHVYGKAGVHTRSAFQSLFFEDLLDLSEKHAEDVEPASA
jgi:DNA-binding CsgD family transcriptional regulator